MTLSGAPRLGFRERQIARDLEFSSVYVMRPVRVAIANQFPVRVAVAAMVEKRFADIQATHWETLEIAKLYWFDGKLLADRVCHMAETYLARDAKKLRGDWFDAKTELAANLVEKAALTLNIRWFDDVERRRRLTAEIDARLTRAADRLLGAR